MIIQQILKKLSILCLPFAFLSNASATIVQFQTNLGNIEVNLYDQDTPETVANFLSYVASGEYTNSVMHRLVPGFIVQGGGFSVSEGVIDYIPTVQSPINEPKFSSVIGTIAMAKKKNDPNSASSQWFFNLADNSANLDVQNGGFTVFGEVTAGMDVLTAIAALDILDLNKTVYAPIYTEIPIAGEFSVVPMSSLSSSVDLFIATPTEYLLMVNAITVLDAGVDTAASLNPVANTLLNAPSVPAPKKKKKSGAIDLSLLMTLLMLSLYMARCRAVKHAI